MSLLCEHVTSCESKQTTDQNVKKMKDAEVAESVPRAAVQFCIHRSSGQVIHFA
jgi:hypothetical protein